MARVLLILFLVCGCSSSKVSHARMAEMLLEKGKYPEARTEYRKHIQERLGVPRPEDENPYFYLVKIGDTFLEENELKKAENIFVAALERGVQPIILGSRFRDLAVKYFTLENNHLLAFKVLKTYRSLDELLFDSLLDELQKKAIKKL